MEMRERMNVLNQLRRLTAGLLSVALLGTLSPAWLPAASAAQADSTSQVRQDTGSIAVTVRFDLPQRVDEVNSRGLRLQITGPGVNAAVSLADGTVSGSGLTAQQVQLEQQNTQGVPLTTEQQLGFSQAVLSQLPLGTYTLTLTGKGYASCSTQVTLKDYSQHVILSTADGSFSLGDVDGSGKVDGKDLSAMDGQLDKTGALDVYDLNGDGLVDITDLAYVNRTAGLTAQPQLLSTSAIVSASVDSGNLTVQGDLNDLFTGGSTVTLAPTEGPELAIPITLENPVEMSEIAITTPSAAGAIQAGTALVETKDGRPHRRTDRCHHRPGQQGAREEGDHQGHQGGGPDRRDPHLRHRDPDRVFEGHRLRRPAARVPGEGAVRCGRRQGGFPHLELRGQRDRL